MIEYAVKTDFQADINPIWRMMPKFAILENNLRFDTYMYQIDGTKYIQQTTEFNTEFERIKIWIQLSGTQYEH